MVVPDFVGDKVLPEKPQQYALLVELSTRTIEIYDATLYAAVYTAAVAWENTLKKKLNVYGSNIDITIRRCF